MMNIIKENKTLSSVAGIGLMTGALVIGASALEKSDNSPEEAQVTAEEKAELVLPKDPDLLIGIYEDEKTGLQKKIVDTNTKIDNLNAYSKQADENIKVLKDAVEKRKAFLTAKKEDVDALRAKVIERYGSDPLATS